MIQIKKRDIDSSDVLSDLCFDSNRKCYYSDMIIPEGSHAIYHEKGLGNYQDGYLVFSSLYELLINGSYVIAEMVNPLKDTPKHHLCISKHEGNISLTPISEKGGKTIDFIKNGLLSIELEKKLVFTKKYVTEQLEIIKNSFYSDTKKDAINQLWRLLDNTPKESLSAVRAAYILSDPTFKKLMDDIEELPETVIQKQSVEKLIQRREILKKFAFQRSKYELYETIEASLRSCEYKTVEVELIKRGAGKPYIERVQTMHSLFDLENVSAFTTVSLHGKVPSSYIQTMYDFYQGFNTDITISEQNFWHIVLYLSVAQKAIYNKRYKLAIQALSWFVEKFCEAMGGGKDGGMKQKYDKMLKVNNNTSGRIYDDIKDSFSYAMKAAKYDGDWISLNQERNAIAHEGKGISENDFLVKSRYLYEEVVGQEQQTNLANKWFSWFGISQVENVFDTMNRDFRKGLITGNLSDYNTSI